MNVTKGHAGIRLYSVSEKEWKGIGGHKDEMISIRECGGYWTRVRDMIALVRGERHVLRWEVDEEEHLDMYGGMEEGEGMKTYLRCPMDCEKNGTAISGERSGLARKERSTPVVEWSWE